MSKRYVTRLIEPVLDTALKTSGAVLIRGPKWCGKTTTALSRAMSSLMVADPAGDFRARALANIDPSIAIAGDTPRLLDEWQEVPKLWDAVRFECDKRQGEPGQFILTGSATPNDQNMPMHSGAGRIARIDMGTMTLAELGVSNRGVSLSGLFHGETYSAIGSLGIKDVAELIVRGGWPAAMDVPTNQAARLARDYVEIVCESDVSDVDGVRRDPDKVRLLIKSLARNESTLAGSKAVAADVEGELTRQTASKYESILARLHFTNNIPAWDPAIRASTPLRSARKRHLADPSLAAAALGVDVDSLVLEPKTLGFLFESLVLHDLIVYADANEAMVSHYHDRRDLEVDAIVSKGPEWLAIEIKLGMGGVDDGIANLVKLEEKMVAAGNRSPARKCVIVGTGPLAYVSPEGVQVIPIDTLEP